MRSVGRSRAAWLFQLPFLGCFIAFLIVPIGMAIYFSTFQRRHVAGQLFSTRNVFVGSQNYLAILSSSTFWHAVERVLLYGVVVIPITLGGALVVALLLDSDRTPLRGVFRTIIFSPFAMPGVIGAMVWSFMYVPAISPIVAFVRGLGLRKFSFLSPHVVLWSIGNIAFWGALGFNMVIILAGLQAIPDELIEAATVDGCSRFQANLRIKIPLVRPAIMFSAILGIIGTLQLFAEPLVLSTISTSVSSHYTPNLYVYNSAVLGDRLGFASAMAVVLGITTFFLSFWFIGRMRRSAGLS